MSKGWQSAISYAAAAASLAALLALAGCAHLLPRGNVNAGVASTPARQWTPTAEARKAAAPPHVEIPKVPDSWLHGKTILTLPQVLDMALANNPSTRAAWYQARAAAAQLGDKRSAWYPQLSLSGDLERQKSTALGGRFTFLQTTYGPSAALSFLLFDFGGRQGNIGEARDLLFASNWTHNATIQNVVLEVESAYYGYLNAKSLLAAQEATVREARQNYDAADARHSAGVATIADVLEAKTALSQAQLNLETIQGQIQTLRGSLATALGFPASYAKLPVDIGDLPETVDVDTTQKDVDALIAQAEKERPDLLSVRATAAAAREHLTAVRAQGLPTLSVLGSANRVYYREILSGGTPYGNNYSGEVLLTIPLFTGFQNSYDAIQAQEQFKADEQNAVTLQQQVDLQVWTSYYNVRTAAQQVKTSRDLLNSATQSEEVAHGRYKSGVGSILDLLTAQSALASARAQEVQARSNWFQTLAQLAHDTGALSPASATTMETDKR